MKTCNRLRYFRKRRNLTQKELGMMLGFRESCADVRIAQYESGLREPREKLRAAMSDALNISPQALTIHSLATTTSLMHLLFAIEDIYGLTIECRDGLLFLNPGYTGTSAGNNLLSCLAEWYEKRVDLLRGRITREEYDDWRYNYRKGQKE